MARPSHFTRSARKLLRSEPDAITHALTCASCRLRPQGLAALALADWSEQDWYDDHALQLMKAACML